MTINKQALLESLKKSRQYYIDHNKEYYAGEIEVFNDLVNEIESGRFDSPSDDRLRVALESLPDKIMNIDSIADDTLNFPLDNPTHEEQSEWFDEFCGRMKEHMGAVIEEALSTTAESSGATCDTCQGEGEIIQEGVVVERITCPDCYGRGDY